MWKAQQMSESLMGSAVCDVGFDGVAIIGGLD